MTDISPAALAVRDAAEKETDLDFRFAPLKAIAAAALEAAADQVVPYAPKRARPYHERLAQRQHTRTQLLAIAAELRGNTTTTGTQQQ